MSQLGRFLKVNEKELIDFIEGNQRPIAIGNNLFAKLLEELVNYIPLSTGLDKAHIELAIAILESFWCGWLSRAKANRGAYSTDFPERMKKAIFTAFELGQDYSIRRP